MKTIPLNFADYVLELEFIVEMQNQVFQLIFLIFQKLMKQQKELIILGPQLIEQLVLNL